LENNNSNGVISSSSPSINEDIVVYDGVSGKYDKG